MLFEMASWKVETLCVLAVGVIVVVRTVSFPGLEWGREGQGGWMGAKVE